MSLGALQSAFRSWLHEGSGDAPAGFGPGSRPGLEVYRNNYRSQLAGCLEASFPATLAWIGEGAFKQACLAHIASVPPSSWTIDAYAAGFPATLRDIHPSDWEIAELAWLEWALGEAFISPDEQPLGASDLANIDWEHAILEISRSVLVGEARTSAGAIWSAISLGDDPPPAQPLPSASGVIVWRSGLRSMFRTVDAIERAALQKVASGTSFGLLCGGLVAGHGRDEGTRLAGSLLGRWIGDGLIVGVDDGREAGPYQDLPEASS
jgi:hypothetical protein